MLKLSKKTIENIFKSTNVKNVQELLDRNYINLPNFPKETYKQIFSRVIDEKILGKYHKISFYLKNC
jgi:hypothetical protein